MLNSFVRVMSTAIDARSPYNANHTRNMARYAQGFVEWLTERTEETFDDERKQQFLMSVWLHDIGKLAVPLEVMDKESRLGAREADILQRFIIFDLQNQINMLHQSIDIDIYERRAAETEHALKLVQSANRVGYITEEMLTELRELGEKTAFGPHGEEPYLSPEELTCLMVRKGTLTDAERHTMENHVSMTQKMLAEMTFPRHFRFVPDWASAHHEHLNGKGYPQGLTAEKIPIEVRILTMVDIYDALTARDRPYKPALPSSKAFAILDDMASAGQIDARLVQLFRESEVWK